MGVTREIYVSAVESELGTARAAVAARLLELGYRSLWHEYSAEDSDDCRALLARRIRSCKAVIQLVGTTYGPEPQRRQQVGGRTSYAQYEALCAREIDQPVWHFMLDDEFARDARPVESAESVQLQATYRRRVETFATFSRPISSLDQLTSEIDELRSDLVRFRRRTTLRKVRSFFARFSDHRIGLNGHSPEETRRVQS